MNSFRKLLLAIAVSVTGGLMLGAGAASADYLGFQGSFDGAGSTPDSGFIKPTVLAVNGQTGDVLVLDEGTESGETGWIKQFDASGAPKPFSALGGSNTIGPFPLKDQEFWGKSTDLAVDSSTSAGAGNIYVVSFQHRTVYGFGADGTPLGGNWPLQFEGEDFPTGVFVDQDGEVWIGFAAAGETAARQFTPEGDPTGVTRPHWAGGTRLGLDTNRQVYGMLLGGPYGVQTVSGSLFPTLAGSDPGDISIDFATNDAYVVNAGVEILQFNENWKVKAKFGLEEPDSGFEGLVNSQGVAFSAFNGKIYASETATSPPRIDIFGILPTKPPVVAGVTAREVRSAGARIEGVITPDGLETTYKVEYGTTSSYGSVKNGLTTVSGSKPTRVVVPIDGLTPGTTYHYRLVATTGTTSTSGSDLTFTTYTYPQTGVDACPNALARQQSGTTGLLDCRAYEQVSALDAGGYDVESNQVSNGSPLAGFPGATSPSRVAYTTSSGSIPNTGNPTGHVGDPYIATRTENGWVTEYVGIAANGTPQAESFSSSLIGADAALRNFAFGGPGLCQVCLPDGSRGIPIRTASGELIQGMAGSLKPSGAAPAGHIAKHFSEDGAHFIFGSTAKFEADGNDNGDVTIYDRDLASGQTHVVSKTPGGATMTGAGIAALDLSSDGSRILVAQKVAADSKGNDYWHLYMNVGDAGQTIDVTPGAASGVLYDGMTADGSKVFFTSADPLTADDHDTSKDIYRADVSDDGASLTRISVGSEGSGDTDSCSPVSDFAHTRWNALTSDASCDVVAIAGGGGVGVGDGSFYFLSPELLDGASNGVVDAPNLYAVAVGGAPQYVTTLESSLDPPADQALRRSVSSLFSVGKSALGIAVDPDSGDFFVLKNGSGGFDDGTAVVEKFDSDGNPSNWTFSAPYVSGNQLIKSGEEFFNFNGNGFSPGSGQIAIDNSGGPADGYVYITNGNGNTAVFKKSGEKVGTIGSGGCGVATDLTGKIFTANWFETRRFVPVDGDPANNTSKELVNLGFPPGVSPCQEATDSTGALYINSPGGSVKRFAAVQLNSKAPKSREYPVQSTSLAVDPATDTLFINEKTQISQWNAAGEKVVSGIGAGILKDSRGIWVDGGQVYASDFATGMIYKLGPVETVPDPVEGNPLVINAVDSPGVRQTADFQVAQEGGVAVFPSNLSLTASPADRFARIYRAEPGGGLLCLSCTPTGEAAHGDSSLPPNGLSITADGKIFFTTGEPLVLRDGGGRKDVYEWSDGDLQLISTGTSPFDATLLTASLDGADVYFFSRDDLLSNGSGHAMKIFDARTGGGKFILPTPAPCAASDECHGRGTEPAPPQGIGTITGIGGQHKQPRKVRCKKGKVRRHGKCVKKPKKQQQKAKSTRRNG